MKKWVSLLLALMLATATMAYAGGDQNCGSQGQGSTGSTGQGQTSQNRAAAD